MSGFFDRSQILVLELIFYQIRNDGSSSPKAFVANMFQTGFTCQNTEQNVVESSIFS